MTMTHLIGGFAALIVLAAFIGFAFRQGMKVRPSRNEHNAGIGATYSGGESIGGESHGGGDSGH